MFRLRQHSMVVATSRARCFACAVSLATVAPPAVSAAVEAAVPPAAYSLRVWEVEDGLPHNSVTSVIQRRDGFLWLATLDGVVRFDGHHFMPVNSPLLADAKASSVRLVAEENATALLVLSTKSGLLRFADDTMSVHPLMARVETGRRLMSLFREADDVFWVAFADKELWRWDHGRIDVFPAPAGLTPYPLTTFAQDRQGRIFLSRGAGIERYDGTRLDFLDTAPAEFASVAGSISGGIWIVTAQAIHRLVEERVEQVAAPPGWAAAVSPPSVFLETRDGALWISVGQAGLYRWTPEALTAVNTSHAKINELLEDDEGNVWAATNGGGLNRLQPSRFALLAADPGWTTDMAGAVCEDGAGHIWFGNRNGLRSIAGGRIESVGARPDWPAKALPLTADAAGQLWFAADARLYRAAPGGTAPPVQMTHEAEASIRVIFGARDGSIWVGRESGPVQHYRDGIWRSVGTAAGVRETAPVQAIAEDRHGRIWIGNADGELFLLEGEEAVTRFGRDEGLPDSAIRAIHVDAADNVWVATGGGGLAVRVDERFVILDKRHGLPDHVLSQMLEDDFGALWVGSNRGLFKVPKTDLLACARGERLTVTPVKFGRSDGLPGVSAIGSYQPTAWKTRSGQLWFVTRKGLVTTNPAEHAGGRASPRVYLERFSVDDRPVPAASPKIASAARRIEFRYTAPAFTDPENVSFRYWLEGFDRGWSEPTSQRAVTYAALPPGEYRFRVTAVHGDSGWNLDGAALAFEVRPRWWETWWATAMALGLASVGMIGGARYWSHRRLRATLARLEQERRLEAERTRIARDLHDDLGASLTQVGMIAEELAEDSEDVAATKTGASRLLARVRGIARDLDAVVWTVSPQNDRLPSLCAYVGQFALEYFRQTPIRCRVHQPECIPEVRLSPEARHHLFMIAKEAMNNVLKHSRAREVAVTWRMVGGAAELLIADDGHGGAAALGANAGRNGLENMRARARDMRAKLEIASGSGGTTVTVHLPLSEEAEPSRMERH